MYAIAHALEGMSRAEAARLAGMERQALRDAVVHYNVEGLSGLLDRPKGHPPQRLTDGEQATLMAVIFKGPDPNRDGVCAWTRADLCRWMQEHLGKSMHPSSLSRVLRRMGLSRQKARPVHPRSDPKAQEQFAKRGCGTP
jgi:putative transposase